LVDPPVPSDSVTKGSQLPRDRVDVILGPRRDLSDRPDPEIPEQPLDGGANAGDPLEVVLSLRGGLGRPLDLATKTRHLEQASFHDYPSVLEQRPEPGVALSDLFSQRLDLPAAFRDRGLQRVPLPAGGGEP